MTVVSVYGSIQGNDAEPIEQSGDTWTFEVPDWITGEFIAEFWAEDEAGNTTYRTGVFTIADGTVKCIRWLTTDGICIMKTARPEVTATFVRPSFRAIDHACPQNGVEIMRDAFRLTWGDYTTRIWQDVSSVVWG